MTKVFCGGIIKGVTPCTAVNLSAWSTQLRIPMQLHQTIYDTHGTLRLHFGQAPYRNIHNKLVGGRHGVWIHIQGHLTAIEHGGVDLQRAQVNDHYLQRCFFGMSPPAFRRLEWDIAVGFTRSLNMRILLGKTR